MITTTKQLDLFVYNQIKILNQSLLIKNIPEIINAKLGPLPNLKYLFIENCHPSTAIDLITQVKRPKDCHVLINNYLNPLVNVEKIAVFFPLVPQISVVEYWFTDLDNLSSYDEWGISNPRNIKLISETSYQTTLRRYQESEIQIEETEIDYQGLEKFHQYNQHLNKISIPR